MKPNDANVSDSDDPDKSKDDGKKVDYSYRDANYWALPENVRAAIDVAKMKSKHSEFYYRLQTLNDKIFIFRNIYYDKMPSFQRVFLERKKKELE